MRQIAKFVYACIAVLIVTIPVTIALTSDTYRNTPLKQWDPNSGYRAALFQSLTEEKVQRGHLDQMWFSVNFSGGGTRAAAFAYGVLEELADIEITVDEQPLSLVEEVDEVSGVSGGSFTASYYALNGDRIFEDYEARFLKRNVQGALIFRLLWPWNWVRLMSPYYSRSDLAIDYYDEYIFGGATFADLEKGEGPTLRVNATDLSTGNAFRFSQGQFDFLCSDLSSFPVARAVGASAAVPMLFPPVMLRNYSGTCGFDPPAWLERALGKSRQLSVRRWRNARVLESYLDSELRPFIHLVDGGISDNLAIRDPLEMAADVTYSEMSYEIFRDLRYVVSLVVNAQTESKIVWSLVDQNPSVGSLLASMTNAQIDVLSSETLELMLNLQTLLKERTAQANLPTEFYLIEVSFQNTEDKAEREYLNSLPTSLSLPDEDVDRLRKNARELLRNNPEFQRLLRDLGKVVPLRINS
jgi:NTE family protein